MGALLGVFVSVFDVENRESRESAILLFSHDAAHALDHLPALARTGNDDRKIRLGYVDSFIEKIRG